MEAAVQNSDKVVQTTLGELIETLSGLALEQEASFEGSAVLSYQLTSATLESMFMHQRAKLVRRGSIRFEA